MARPTKCGVDYFPLDCHMSDSMKLIEAEFGIIGFGVVVKLFQKIYGQRGYYAEWTPEVALLFARECGLGGNVVSEIVRACAKRGIFNDEILQKYSVLTSEGIQKRYFNMVSRRESIEIVDEYLLVPYAQNFVSARNNEVSVSNNPENACNNPQSKVKESKRNKRRESAGAPAHTHTHAIEGGERSFEPPTREEVQAYCTERGGKVDADRFFDYYTARGWMLGKVPMQDWQAEVRAWEKSGTQQSRKPSDPNNQSFDVNNFFNEAIQRSYGRGNEDK